MLWTILVPEYLLTQGWNDHASAHSGRMKEYGWQQLHIYLANIGYFVLYFVSSSVITSPGHQEGQSELVKLIPSDGNTALNLQEASDAILLTPICSDGRVADTEALWDFENHTNNVKALKRGGNAESDAISLFSLLLEGYHTFHLANSKSLP